MPIQKLSMGKQNGKSLRIQYTKLNHMVTYTASATLVVYYIVVGYVRVYLEKQVSFEKD